MTQENLDKVKLSPLYEQKEKEVVALLDKIKSIEGKLYYNIPYRVEKALIAEKTPLLEQFSKAQDEFYKFLQEVFLDSIELEDVWSTYVSWFRPWNNRQNNGELREIIGEPWKN